MRQRDFNPVRRNERADGGDEGTRSGRPERETSVRGRRLLEERWSAEVFWATTKRSEYQKP